MAESLDHALASPPVFCTVILKTPIYRESWYTRLHLATIQWIGALSVRRIIMKFAWMLSSSRLNDYIVLTNVQAVL